ncbi:MAG: hypothetical protein MJK13_01875 [Pseudomonadales bacterium]|nr:hypothetical protein [Pseudomonadales bacterium]
MPKIHSLLKLFASLCLLSIISGCASNNNKSFRIESLAKSELDMVIDTHLIQNNQQAIALLKKLYKRNPKELKKAPAGTNINSRIKQLFSYPRQIQFSELGDKYANSALLLAFSNDFQGDRVFAFMTGIAGILHSSYNYQDEFFMLDPINEQKVYNSARNLETASWLLNSEKDLNSTRYILSNSYTDGTIANLSFARLFGKMIAGQDILADIIANRNNRTINKFVHGIASTTLLPI